MVCSSGAISGFMHDIAGFPVPGSMFQNGNNWSLKDEIAARGRGKVG